MLRAGRSSLAENFGWPGSSEGSGSANDQCNHKRTTQARTNNASAISNDGSRLYSSFAAALFACGVFFGWSCREFHFLNFGFLLGLFTIADQCNIIKLLVPAFSGNVRSYVLLSGNGSFVCPFKFLAIEKQKLPIPSTKNWRTDAKNAKREVCLKLWSRL